jgi:predicted nucleotidyltransferase component of viral defense system
LTLSRLAHSKNVENAVFKGGTSLSKGYRIISRFSEDIDIAMINKNLSGNALKTEIRNIEKEITVGLTEIVEDGVTSKGSMFRKSIFEYSTLLSDKVDTIIPNRMIVEINSFANPYPNVKQQIASFITEYLAANNQAAAIEEYGLQPFSLNVLDKRRTMIEKLVSLFRFSFAENVRRSLSAKIRHFYDLYYLAKDTECAAYIQTPNFKQDFTELLAHDKQVFDTPANWNDKEITQSPLVVDFPALWNFLKDIYLSELPQLAFIPIPDEKEVADTFSHIIKNIPS